MVISDSYPISTIISKEAFPRLAQHARMPEKLSVRGKLPSPDATIVSIVGTRSPTEYGIAAVKRIVAGLSGTGVTVASGLAYGIDGIALEAAIARNIPTIAYPGSGVRDDVLYPRIHLGLARRILESGGCLVSHFPDNAPARPYFFPERNRVLAALSHSVVAIECMVRSGTMITAMAGAELGAEVGAVPGSIDSVYAAGPHELIRRGAFVVESAEDILDAIGLRVRHDPFAPDAAETEANTFVMPGDCGPEEQTIMNSLLWPRTRDELCESTKLEAHTLARWLSVLELKGHVEYIAGRVARIRK
jgi:DNA processing protein